MHMRHNASDRLKIGNDEELPDLGGIGIGRQVLTRKGMRWSAGCITNMSESESSVYTSVSCVSLPPARPNQFQPKGSRLVS